MEVFCVLSYHEIYGPVFLFFFSFYVLFLEKSISVDIYLVILVNWHKLPRTVERQFAFLPSSGCKRTSERWMELGNEDDI